MNNNPPAYQTFLLNVDWHARIIGFIVGLFMLAIYAWMIAGFAELMFGLYHAYPKGWSHGAELMIKNVVVILASLELIRIFQSYLQIGRVKVTFILDVALVVLIGELISFWYRETQTIDMVVSVGVISVLTILRIVSTKYSPDNTDSNLQGEINPNPNKGQM